jgi:hypothetical protein
MDIRRIALIACVASVLGLLIPTWSAAHRMAALGSTYPQWLIILGFVTATLFDAILPVFYFALYRDKGTLLLSRGLRLLALTAALLLGMSVVIDLSKWIGSLGQAGTRSILETERRLWTASDVSNVFTLLSNVACVLLMVWIYRQRRDEAAVPTPFSKLLRVMARLAVVAWGICVAISLLRLVLSPHTYATLRNEALQIGRTLPPFRDMVVEETRLLLSQAGLLAAPYVIWRAGSQPKGDPRSEDLVSAPINPLSR